MSWECACGISNGDGKGKCGGCGWTRQQAEEYIRNPPGSKPPPPLKPGMKEYKVVSLDEEHTLLGDAYSSKNFENSLNSIAREGWSLMEVINTNKFSGVSMQKVFLIFERTLTEEMLVGRIS